MNEFILKKFDALPEDCLIWNLGDIFLNLRIEASRIMNDIMRMKKNRKMNLILGNHDFRARKKPFSNYIEYFEHLGFDKVYKGTLGCENIIFETQPVEVVPIICEEMPQRGHFITFVYECRLPKGFIVQNKTDENEAGFLKWHDTCPDNILKVHEFYRKYWKPSIL